MSNSTSKRQAKKPRLETRHNTDSLQASLDAAKKTDAALTGAAAALRVAQANIIAAYKDLEKNQADIARDNGNDTVEVEDDELLEINAGGQVVEVLRGTLTQMKGTTLSGLFSGRWENQFMRDEKQRIFLDINPTHFRIIVDCLNEMENISSEHPLLLDLVGKDEKDSLFFLVSLFGLGDILGLSLEEDPWKEIENKMPSKAPEKWETADFNDHQSNIKDALIAEQKALIAARDDLTAKKVSLEKEKALMRFFTSHGSKHIVRLNVRGKFVSTTNSTLGVFKESALAKQFDDAKWSGGQKERSLEWNPEQVCSWCKMVKGMPKTVGEILFEHNVSGCELLSMKKADFKKLGISGSRTLSLLSEAIKDLQNHTLKATFIDHSPYCFQKILDHLRFQSICQCSPVDYIVTPSIHESQTEEFFKTVDYFFPGESAPVNIDSTIISLKEAGKIRSWLKEDNLPSTLKLLYRATRDGWKPSDFHSCCDNMGPTVVIVESQGGYVFGGFADVSWSGDGGYKASAKAFLFALRSYGGVGPTKIHQKKGGASQALYHHSNLGATFGIDDFLIGDDPCSGITSFASLGSSFECPAGHNRETFLTGARELKPAEIEVYALK